MAESHVRSHKRVLDVDMRDAQFPTHRNSRGARAMVDARDGLISPLDSASILGNHVDTGEVCQFRCGARGVEAGRHRILKRVLKRQRGRSYMVGYMVGYINGTGVWANRDVGSSIASHPTRTNPPQPHGHESRSARFFKVVTGVFIRLELVDG